MNKYFSFFIIAVIAMLSFKTITARDCPSGTSTEWVTWEIFECDYDIKICYTCPSTQPGIVQVFAFGKDDQCVHDPPRTVNEVYEAIMAEIKTESFINGLCGAPGPCDDPPYGYEIIVRYYVCWQMYNDNNDIFYWPCNPQVYCDEIWKYCYDTNSGDYVFVLQQRDPPDDEDVYCTTDIQEIDPPSPSQWSDCGYIESQCYP